LCRSRRPEDHNALQPRKDIPAPHDRVACHPADLPADMLEALEQSIAEDEAEGIVAADLPIVKF
jgi:hypothetical protein